MSYIQEKINKNTKKKLCTLSVITNDDGTVLLYSTDMYIGKCSAPSLNPKTRTFFKVK